MLSNYLRTALRAFARHRLHFVLNLAGLTLGLTAALLIALYASFEASYDQQQPNAERVWRLEQYYPSMAAGIPLTNKNAINRLRQQSGIEDVLTLEPLTPGTEFRVGEQRFRLDGVMGVGANLADFIHLELLSGNLSQTYLAVWQLLVWVGIFGSFFPMLFSYLALGNLSATAVGIASAAETVFAFAFGWLWLNEKIEGLQALGGLLVITGIVIAQTARVAKASVSSQ